MTARAESATGRPRRLVRWLLPASLVVVLLVLGWLVAFSRVLGVSSIEVDGSRALSADQIRAAAAIPDGTPLIRLDTAAVRARVAALPQVRSVSVHKVYPSVVRIDVTERVLVAFRHDGAGFGWIDATDVRFRTSAAAPAAVPELVPAGAATADPAGAGAADPAGAEAAVAGELPSALARKVLRIGAVTPESVTLTLRDGRVVLWGGTDRGSDKARLVTALLSQPGNYFDVSDPSSVISRGSAAGSN